MKFLGLIRQICVLSALFHDVGKSNKAFQSRLKNGLQGGDYYRHEYLSLKIFMIIVEACEDDATWLKKLSICDKTNVFDTQYIKAQLAAQIANKSFERADISTLPPLAQWVAWLIVTHHRLPPSTDTQIDDHNKQLQKLQRQFDINTLNDMSHLHNLYEGLESFKGWQKNEIVAQKDESRALDSVQFDSIITDSKSWQAMVAKYASDALNNSLLFNGNSCVFTQTMQDPFLLHMSRLILVLSDHNYSSLDSDGDMRFCGDNLYRGIYANSNSDCSVRQSLDEHLIGVAMFCDKLITSLPSSLSHLPKLECAPVLSTDTDIYRFKWQNNAFKKAKEYSTLSRSNGFFCVNLASTGCGKTICNARIVRALSEDTGSRFTVALGLRTLTLQTAESFREDLKLSAKELAILVGGEANTELFMMNKSAGEVDCDTQPKGGHASIGQGSESIDIGQHQVINSEIDVSLYPFFNTLLSNRKSKQMLLSPILVCTIDHIIQASEGLHGGKNIAPSLRLFTGDLVLDEPDDFGVDDLYALSRLVFTAGMCGSRVVLSSATLTPSMVRFLFDAYSNGRHLFNKNNGHPTGDDLLVPCMIVDEQDCTVGNYRSHNDIYKGFNDFAQARCSYLDNLPARRFAEIMPMQGLCYDKDFPEVLYKPLAQSIINQASVLHDRHHEQDLPSGKSISVGLIRLTYTKSVIALAKEFLSSVEVDDDTCIHFCCYHSRQLLAIRNQLEVGLDSVLKRSDKSVMLAGKPLIAEAINKSNCTKHIFIVLATPIAEVGRDHDYDWSIVEPSSMRSIIQLAGRVWRHRPDKVADKPNMAILQYNLRYFTANSSYGDSGVFIHSGFEGKDNKPCSYNLDRLISARTLEKIDSKSRLDESDYTQPAPTLAQLEHNRIMQVLDSKNRCLANSVWHYQSRMYNACTDIYLLTKFRKSDEVEKEFVATLTPHKEIEFYLKKELLEKSVEDAICKNHIIVKQDIESQNPRINLWLDFNILDVVDSINQKLNYNDVSELMLQYFTAQLRDTNYFYNEFLGFYQ